MSFLRNGNDLRTRVTVIFAVLFFSGLYFLITFGADSSAMAKGMKDISTITPADFRKGEFVQGTVYELDGVCAEMVEERRTLGIKTSERTSAYYYVMPLLSTMGSGEENVKYVAVKIANTAAIQTADKMVDETFDYYINGTQPESWTELSITGKIEPLNNELKGYFEEWMNDMYGEEDAPSYYKNIVPYVISWYSPTGASGGMTTGAVIMAIGACGLGVMIALYVKNRRQPAFTDYGNGSYTGMNTGTGSAPVSGTSPTFTSDFGTGASGSVPSYGTDSGYKPVGTPPPAEPPQEEEKPRYTYSAEAGSMDEIDTSALGLGENDENK